MEESLLGVVVGSIGLKAISSSVHVGTDFQSSLEEWFNTRRFNRLKTKAEAVGFGDLFSEEWNALGMDDPRCQHGMEAVMAFQPARVRFHVDSL